MRLVMLWIDDTASGVPGMVKRPMMAQVCPAVRMPTTSPSTSSEASEVLRIGRLVSSEPPTATVFSAVSGFQVTMTPWRKPTAGPGAGLSSGTRSSLRIFGPDHHEGLLPGLRGHGLLGAQRHGEPAQHVRLG